MKRSTARGAHPATTSGASAGFVARGAAQTGGSLFRALGVQRHDLSAQPVVVQSASMRPLLVTLLLLLVACASPPRTQRPPAPPPLAPAGAPEPKDRATEVVSAPSPGPAGGDTTSEGKDPSQA